MQDPSLSHATKAPVRNLLGIAGAIIADLSMQMLGLGALALVLPIAIWGWRLASHRPLRRERIRLVVWIVGVVLTAAFAACLPRVASWPLPVGLGGVVGDALLRAVATLTGGSLGGFGRLLIGTVTAAGGFAALAIACGFGLHGGADTADDEEEEEVEEAAKSDADDEGKEGRASISLGLLVHGFLSLKARLRAHLCA